MGETILASIVAASPIIAKTSTSHTRSIPRGMRKTPLPAGLVALDVDISISHVTRKNVEQVNDNTVGPVCLFESGHKSLTGERARPHASGPRKRHEGVPCSSKVESQSAPSVVKFALCPNCATMSRKTGFLLSPPQIFRQGDLPCYNTFLVHSASYGY